MHYIQGDLMPINYPADIINEKSLLYMLEAAIWRLLRHDFLAIAKCQ